MRVAFAATIAGAIVATSLLSGCPDRPIAEVSQTQVGQSKKFIPITTDIDILFVIDDSPSTKDKQDVFAANFGNFVQALDGFATGRPNLHIGVVTSSIDIKNNNFGSNCPSPNLTYDGRLQNSPTSAGCPAPSDRYISDIKSGGSRMTNYSGTLDQSLSCIAEIGAGGCGFEMPLEAMKRALDDSHPENSGFLRPGAYLAVIILTDEDDASVHDFSLFNLDMATNGPGDFRAQPLYAYTCDTPISGTMGGSYKNCKTRTGSYLEAPQTYHDFLAKKKSEGQVVVAVLGGSLDNPANTIKCDKTAGTCDVMTGAITDPFNQTLALEPSCSTTINGAHQIGRPGIRLNDFVKSFGTHGLFETICQPDYSGALKKIGDLLFQSVSPCLDGKIADADTDMANPGVQPDCSVSDVVNLNTPQQMQTQMSACKMSDATTPDPSGARPCWWVKSNEAACKNANNTTAAPYFEIHVERSSAPAAGTNVQVACATN
jgi:hypothetical protein